MRGQLRVVGLAPRAGDPNRNRQPATAVQQVTYSVLTFLFETKGECSYAPEPLALHPAGRGAAPRRARGRLGLFTGTPVPQRPAGETRAASILITDRTGRTLYEAIDPNDKQTPVALMEAEGVIAAKNIGDALFLPYSRFLLSMRPTIFGRRILKVSSKPRMAPGVIL